MGGLSIGVVALGGVAIGVVALGGVAVGFLALGGVALGGHALGGVTLGLLGARGGLNLLGAVVLFLPLASVIGSRWVRRSFSPHPELPEHDNRPEAPRAADR